MMYFFHCFQDLVYFNIYMKLVTFITPEGYSLISLNTTFRLSYSANIPSSKSALNLLCWVMALASIVISTKNEQVCGFTYFSLEFFLEMI